MAKEETVAVSQAGMTSIIAKLCLANPVTLVQFTSPHALPALLPRFAC